MSPSVVVPTTILRDDHEQKRPVCTPTSKKRRQLKKTTKVKYENEDPHPPLGLFFGGMWVAPMTNQHEQHGDHSTRRFGQHKHTHIDETKKTKTKRRKRGPYRKSGEEADESHKAASK